MSQIGESFSLAKFHTALKYSLKILFESVLLSVRNTWICVVMLGMFFSLDKLEKAPPLINQRAVFSSPEGTFPCRISCAWSACRGSWRRRSRCTYAWWRWWICVPAAGGNTCPLVSDALTCCWAELPMLSCCLSWHIQGTFPKAVKGVRCWIPFDFCETLSDFLAYVVWKIYLCVYIYILDIFVAEMGILCSSR